MHILNSYKAFHNITGIKQTVDLMPLCWISISPNTMSMTFWLCLCVCVHVCVYACLWYCVRKSPCEYVCAVCVCVCVNAYVSLLMCSCVVRVCVCVCVCEPVGRPRRGKNTPGRADVQNTLLFFLLAPPLAVILKKVNSEVGTGGGSPRLGWFSFVFFSFVRFFFSFFFVCL